MFSFQSYPFDWRKPLGFAACITEQSVFVYSLGRIYTCSLISTIGHCLYAGALTSDAEENLRELNEEFNEIDHKMMSFQKRLEVRRKFIEIIEFYLSSRE